MVIPSGEQFQITHGRHLATIVEVGGGIREYAVGDRDVLEPYPVDAICDGAHGAALIPWPNRLRDGTYTFEGTDHQLAVTEPELNNAIHGLLRWRSWRAIEHEPHRVLMHTRVHPMNGYPFLLDVQIEYVVGEDGLTVTTTVTNLGDSTCPYGTGHHPYLSPGEGLVDECTLEMHAAGWIDTNNERRLPVGTHPTAGTSLDFSVGRVLGDQVLDFPFKGLSRDSDGRAWVRLTGPDGARVELWVDDSHPYVELYTGDTLGDPDRRRRGLGAEPMTCPPDAFRSGEGLIHLAPGDTFSSTWGVGLATSNPPG